MSTVPMEGASIGKVTVNGVKLHYMHKGAGPHVLFCIPGSLAPAEFAYTPQFEYFGREGSGFKIVTFDLRGYGGSRPAERFKADTFYTTDVRDAQALMQAMGFQKYSVLGWSHGGGVAMMLAAMFPESVEKLILIGSKAFHSQEDFEAIEKTKYISSWSPRLRQTMTQWYSNELLQELWAKLLDILIEIREKYDGNICRDELSKIGCPTLILHGAKDSMVTLSHAHYLRDHIGGSQLEVMEEAKHYLHHKFSKEANELVERFTTI